MNDDDDGVGNINSIYYHNIGSLLYLFVCVNRFAQIGKSYNKFYSGIFSIIPASIRGLPLK